MRYCRVLAAAIVSLGLLANQAPYVSAQGAGWLEAPLNNWNTPGAGVPVANPQPPDNPRCAAVGRPPETAIDRQLTERGWSLFGAYEGGWGVEIVHAGSGVDGMCRPLGFNVFVFRHGQFVGTVSPELMNSRTTGQETATTLGPGDEPSGGVRITSRFLRYGPNDALCCPSLPAVSVVYDVTRTPAGWVLTPTNREQD